LPFHVLFFHVIKFHVMIGTHKYPHATATPPNKSISTGHADGGVAAGGGQARRDAPHVPRVQGGAHCPAQIELVPELMANLCNFEFSANLDVPTHDSVMFHFNSNPVVLKSRSWPLFEKLIYADVRRLVIDSATSSTGGLWCRSTAVTKRESVKRNEQLEPEIVPSIRAETRRKYPGKAPEKNAGAIRIRTRATRVQDQWQAHWATALA
jgi:hypothetical protein